MLQFSFNQLVVIIPVILCSMVIHEFAHTFAALLLGDRSPAIMARLTLNPLKHIDPIGFLMIILVGFGWAKPVRINPSDFKKPVRDEILVGLAGPASNFLLAFLIMGILKLLVINDVALSINVINGFEIAVLMNIVLGVFNLIPIPPLDGSHLYTSILYQKNRKLYITVMRYGSMALLFLIIASRVTSIDFLPIGTVIEGVYFKLVNVFFG
ncbi:MAG: site-2 protease family protein [Vallitaleaceae bacterium]|jgi:Zn-dependent protease|nr:site-2 protease family protein [Vallitaleaceae bacterium]